MANKHEKCSVLLTTIEMQIQTTLRFHLIQPEQSHLSKEMTTNSGLDVDSVVPLYIDSRKGSPYESV